jgi:hypothetical protein
MVMQLDKKTQNIRVLEVCFTKNHFCGETLKTRKVVNFLIIWYNPFQFGSTFNVFRLFFKLIQSISCSIKLILLS